MTVNFPLITCLIIFGVALEFSADFSAQRQSLGSGSAARLLVKDAGRGKGRQSIESSRLASDHVGSSASSRTLSNTRRARLVGIHGKQPSAASAVRVRPLRGHGPRVAFVTKPGPTVPAGGPTAPFHQTSMAAPYAGGPSVATAGASRRASSTCTSTTTTTSAATRSRRTVSIASTTATTPSTSPTTSAPTASTTGTTTSTSTTKTPVVCALPFGASCILIGYDPYRPCCADPWVCDSVVGPKPGFPGSYYPIFSCSIS